MELWIRSQDKRRLAKINDIRLDKLDDNHIIGNYIQVSLIQSDYEDLGTYKSKERALEILDEIQNYLINSTFAKMQNGLGEDINFIPNPTFVYKMPEK